MRHFFNWSIEEGIIDRTPFKQGDVTLVKEEYVSNRDTIGTVRSAARYGWFCVWCPGGDGQYAAHLHSGVLTH